MRLCVAQTRPVTGDIPRNIENHKRLIDVALINRADMVTFPELSLTGYEPTLASALATDQDDRRLDELQAISDTRQITIGVGIPSRAQTGFCISMVLLQPHRGRRTYSKRYLHRDEEAFFVCGEGLAPVQLSDARIALAICYEISVAEHVERASKSGARVYLASVAKTEKGTTEAIHRLAHIARHYSMTVLMSNCVGMSDGVECAGQTSIWDEQGRLVGQLNQQDEGILLIDTETREVVERTLSRRSGASA
jgi:predicted amidohydrolase